ncbi:hypothetical protein [Streptomyces sp. IBSBF 3136]|uniref:hypothetical protein n=1 Tax=Streptomyces sp. IBSBF 3136 TaxID=2903524 RepID=UPI002FDBD6D7
MPSDPDSRWAGTTSILFSGSTFSNYSVAAVSSPVPDYAVPFTQAGTSNSIVITKWDIHVGKGWLDDEESISDVFISVISPSSEVRRGVYRVRFTGSQVVTNVVSGHF